MRSSKTVHRQPSRPSHGGGLREVVKTPSPHRILLTQHGLCCRNTQQLRALAALGLSAVWHNPPRATFRSDPKAPCFTARREERSRSRVALSGMKTSPRPCMYTTTTLRCSVWLARYHRLPLLYTLSYLTGQVDFCGSREEGGGAGSEWEETG